MGASVLKHVQLKLSGINSFLDSTISNEGILKIIREWPIWREEIEKAVEFKLN
jgi:hypothetical protein